MNALAKANENIKKIVEGPAYTGQWAGIHFPPFRAISPKKGDQIHASLQLLSANGRLTGKAITMKLGKRAGTHQLVFQKLKWAGLVNASHTGYSITDLGKELLNELEA